MIWKYLVIMIILMHGLGHSMGMMPGWVPGQTTLNGTPWMIPFDSNMSKFWGFMWFTVVVIYSIAVVGMLLKTNWWPNYLTVGSMLSIIVIFPWWNTMPLMSRIGAVGVDIILLYILLSPVKERAIAWFSQ